MVVKPLIFFSRIVSVSFIDIRFVWYFWLYSIRIKDLINFCSIAVQFYVSVTLLTKIHAYRINIIQYLLFIYFWTSKEIYLVSKEIIHIFCLKLIYLKFFTIIYIFSLYWCIYISRLFRISAIQYVQKLKYFSY